MFILSQILNEFVRVDFQLNIWIMRENLIFIILINSIIFNVTPIMYKQLLSLILKIHKMLNEVEITHSYFI